MSEVAEQEDVKLEGKTAEFVEWIENITVLELADLVKVLEKKFGVSAAAPVAMVAGPAAGGADAGGAEEQSEFNVMITAAGDKKIQVIKEIRAITGLGLKEAKGIADGAPCAVKEGVAKEEAEEMKAKLEAAGASVELK